MLVVIASARIGGVTAAGGGGGGVSLPLPARPLALGAGQLSFLVLRGPCRLDHSLADHRLERRESGGASRAAGDLGEPGQGAGHAVRPLVRVAARFVRIRLTGVPVLGVAAPVRR
ncbi:hypothetical protein B0J12DRAFT_659771 [Macrophomina phaseolina]|uniref:Uncharacterized protein n=1 Tax=Macrophomina phaseolina TaxID=35725 RepID=A0ABQ8GEK6_9PEZI|nr:hypothetical protein B0J12DRAFT_659771 [Macrophomina phaseolina]